jgi:hypothetical protein
MDLRNRHRTEAAGQASLQSAVLIGVAAVLSVTILVLFLARLPHGLVLPAVGVAALIAGAGVALFAWLFGSRRKPDRISAWDFAGALLFVGFAATVLSRPEQLMQLAL